MTTLYRLFWTSDRFSKWNHESQLTNPTKGLSWDEIHSFLREVEPYCDGGKFGPAYDWRLEQV